MQGDGVPEMCRFPLPTVATQSFLNVQVILFSGFDYCRYCIETITISTTNKYIYNLTEFHNLAFHEWTQSFTLFVNSVELPWSLMGLHGTPRSSTEFHGNSAVLHGS